MERLHSQSRWWLLPSLLAFRCVNALVVQTYFDPDEYWQSLEVAHRLVFGYGYLTWEWREGIRGYSHPLIFAALYKALAFCGWDSPAAVRVAPRLLQGVFAAVGDWFLFKLTARAFSRKAANLALACQLLNWFTFYCIVRPYSNCLETVLTTAALSYWPLTTEPVLTPHKLTVNRDSNPNRTVTTKCGGSKQESARQAETEGSFKGSRLSGGPQCTSLSDGHAAREETKEQAETDSLLTGRGRQTGGYGKREGNTCLQVATTRVGSTGVGRQMRGSDSGVNRPLALLLAALACVVRPTSAVLWAFLGVRELLRTRDKSRFVFREVLPIGVLCLGASTLLDRWMYGEWTVVPLNFVQFNLGGGANAYGTHPWHWYFTGGLPAMATTMLPFAALGVWRTRHHRALSDVILWVLGAYSLLGHKEFRFILPILPLGMALAGQGLATLVPIGDSDFFAPRHNDDLPIAEPHSETKPDSVLIDRTGTHTERDTSGTEPVSVLNARTGTQTERIASGTEAEPDAANRQSSSTLTRRKPFVCTESSADVTGVHADVTQPSADPTGRSADGSKPSADVTGRSIDVTGPSARTSADVTTIKHTANETPADVTTASRGTVATKRDSTALRHPLLFLVLTQVPMALYLSLVHQRGAVRAAEYLAEEARRDRVSGVWFLTPCHATPFYSHVHAPVPMRILDCSPSAVPGDVSEDARFHSSPAAFLAREFDLVHNQRTGERFLDAGRPEATWRQLIGSAAEGLDDRLPSHVILFDSVENSVREILTKQGYVRGPRFFHSHFAVDRELQSHVVMYQLTSQQQPGCH